MNVELFKKHSFNVMLKPGHYNDIINVGTPVCDIDNEVCDLTREVFEDDIGNFIRISEQAEPAAVPAAEAPPQVAQRIINDLINSLRQNHIN
jgi:hypothetical protein